jgi:hypothetical protein
MGDPNFFSGACPLESIGASSNQAGKVRSEMGFIGAHADIGSGYADGENDLSFVALNWIERQAIDSGIKFNETPKISVGNPMLHDQSMAIRVGNPTTSLVQGSRGASFEGIQIRDGRTIGSVKTEDRQVNGAVRGNSARTLGFNNGSMVNADTHQFIDYTARPGQVQAFDDPQIRALKNKTGTVDVTAYTAWLRSHGYCFVGDTKGTCAAK